MSRSTKAMKIEHEGTQQTLPKPTVTAILAAIEDAERDLENYGYEHEPLVWDERLAQRRPVTANEQAKAARYLRREAQRQNRPWLVIARACDKADEAQHLAEMFGPGLRDLDDGQVEGVDF